MAAVMGDETKPSVGLIELSGPISDSGAGGLLGGTSGGARGFIREVEAARKDDNIKSVVIRINSPGGAASASQEMYEAVMRLRKAKPVICSMGDVAESGGYYTAAACTKIYANRATTTGSIGVITEFPNYQELAKKVGIGQSIIKSGKFKDTGNPARPLTAEEKQLFQGLITNLYNQFVNDIVTGRKEATKGQLTREKLLKLANGRVYTGEQAVQNKLIDETGDLYSYRSLRRQNRRSKGRCARHAAFERRRFGFALWCQRQFRYRWIERTGRSRFCAWHRGPVQKRGEGFADANVLNFL